MLSAIVLACYLACAAWLASSVYRAGEHAAHGRRVAGLALGVIALVLHAILLWRVLFDRPVLAFTIAETASLIGWPIGLIAIALSGLRPRFAGIGAVLTLVAGVVAATTVEGSGGAPLVDGPSWEIGAHIVLSTNGSLRGIWFDAAAGSGTINPPGAANPVPLRLSHEMGEASTTAIVGSASRSFS